jgi:glycosyltransferase involved in cell wall biosynthesis
MNELAKRGHKIFWVNQTKKSDKFRTVINENLTVYHTWDKFANKFKGQIDVYFASWSHRWVDIEALQPKYVLYDSLDLFPQNESEEKNMVDKADIILTTANGIYNYHKKHTDKPIHMCENGCFDKYRGMDFKVPNEIQQLRENNLPVLLFSGALALNPQMGWVDIELIRAITSRYYIVCVGGFWGVDDKFKKDNKSIMDKIIFCGAKPYDELQAYYAHCDVNLLPFRRCQTSDYSFPLKTIEGCNHGKICVSSNIPVSTELNEEFGDAVMISSSINGYIKNIDKALQLKNNNELKQQCYNLAEKHTWDKKVDIIENALSKFSQ